MKSAIRLENKNKADTLKNGAEAMRTRYQHVFSYREYVHCVTCQEIPSS